MFSLFEPSAAEIEDYFNSQKNLPFSYPEVGASKNEIPAGYPVNHRRAQLGNGAAAFVRAKKAVENWMMYRLDWSRLYPETAPIVADAAICVIVNHGFCWSLNPCRIVYVLEENDGDVERFGFAFGTLPGHSETGEERFTVEHRHGDDSVWYEVLSFARPHQLLAKIGFPFVTFFQRKFAADSARMLLKGVGGK